MLIGSWTLTDISNGARRRFDVRVGFRGRRPRPSDVSENICNIFNAVGLLSFGQNLLPEKNYDTKTPIFGVVIAQDTACTIQPVDLCVLVKENSGQLFHAAFPHRRRSAACGFFIQREASRVSEVVRAC